jgi:hypothetical protein
MAKRLRDVCGLPESEPLWRAGRGFVVRDLPWTVEKLRVIWRSGVSAERRHLKKQTSLRPSADAPLRSRRIVRRPLENSRDWICRTVALRYRRNSTSEFGFIGNWKCLFPKD